MEKKNSQTVETVPQSYRKFVDRGKIDTTKTYIHDHSISSLGTDTSMKSGGVQLVILAKAMLVK